MSDAERDRRRQPLLGIKRSDATREKLRLKALGNTRCTGHTKPIEERLRTGARRKETHALKKEQSPEAIAKINAKIASSLRGRKATEAKRANHRAAHARGAYKNSKRTSPINGSDVTPAQRLALQLAKVEKKLAKLKAACDA